MEILSYELDLDVDFKNAFLRGKEKITVEGAATPLAFDCSNLNIESVSVNGETAKFRVEEERAKLVIAGVPRKSSYVDIEYTKKISDDVIFGLYKSKYGKHYILVTDLEPAEARTVFPCLDDPAYKAVFKLSITTERGLRVIANTQTVATEDAGGGKTRHVFEDTPRMSTYLLFFAIGHMDEAETMAGRVKVFAATRPGQVRNSDLALEMAAGSVRGFAEYYGVPYPLKKLHVVALPEYHTGAMENWGAISSRESYALVNESAAFGQKSRGAVSIVHEVAHQWFGDLVTMKWWDDLWLNESFATFMSYKMTGRLRPQWDLSKVFVEEETFSALNLDAVRSTHPIQTPVKKVEDALHNFDAISYNKGASVLQMLESYVGEAAFRRGVSNYLKKFSFSNASGSDLWNSLGEASKLPVARVARDWLTRPGFPVIEVKRRGNRTILTQRRFVIGRKISAAPWPIPTSFSSGRKTRRIFFDTRSMTMKSGESSGGLLNAGRMAFHITLYDEKWYDSLALSFAKLDSVDRAGLLNDLYLFLQSGEVDPELYLRFVRLSGGTPDPLTVETVAGQLRALTSIAWDSKRLLETYPGFYHPLLDSIGEEPRPGESDYVGGAREDLATQLVGIDDAYAEKLAPMFEHYPAINPNLKGAVATAFARVKGERAKEPLVDMLKTLQGEVDRAKIWGALCSFREPELVKETLELGLSKDISRSDGAYPLVYGVLNPAAREVYWAWLTKNYDIIRDVYAGSQQFYLYMGRVIPICGVTREKEVRTFLSGGRLRSGGSTLGRALERLEINSRVRSRLLS